jgi:hypothetical protein
MPKSLSISILREQAAFQLGRSPSRHEAPGVQFHTLATGALIVLLQGGRDRRLIGFGASKYQRCCEFRKS